MTRVRPLTLDRAVTRPRVRAASRKSVVNILRQRSKRPYALYHPLNIRRLGGKGLMQHVCMHRQRVPRMGARLIFPRRAELQRIVMHQPRYRCLADAFSLSLSHGGDFGTAIPFAGSGKHPSNPFDLLSSGLSPNTRRKIWHHFVIEMGKRCS